MAETTANHLVSALVLKVRRVLLAPLGLVFISSLAMSDPITTTGDTRQPRNIYELLYSVGYTFSNILNDQELALYRTGNPEEIRRNDPELYNRISQNIQRWTDEWIKYVRTSLVPIPDKKLTEAQRDAAEVDAILKKHFTEKGWPYKTLKVVFLPPQVFLNEYDRGSMTSGMFIRFYPDAFFASVDWPVPMKIVLVHESIHFNKIGTPFGSPLAEGITESATQRIILDYGLLPKGQARKSKAYPVEQKRVKYIIQEMMSRVDLNERQALDLLVEAYVTGDQSNLNQIFGVDPWARLLQLSRTTDNWSTREIDQALSTE